VSAAAVRLTEAFLTAGVVLSLRDIFLYARTALGTWLGEVLSSSLSMVGPLGKASELLHVVFCVNQSRESIVSVLYITHLLCVSGSSKWKLTVSSGVL
jgi:hypothetical protein